MRVAIYYRYSSDLTSQKENSERRQKSELLEFAARQQWNPIWVEGDKATSGVDDKPKLNELKNLVSDRQLLFDVLLISSWDRLTRKDSLDYADDVRWLRQAEIKLAILEKGGEPFDLDDNQRLLLLQMEVYSANEFLKGLSKKVESGLVARFKDNRLKWARIPFGYDKDDEGWPIPNEDNHLIKEIFIHARDHSVASCVEIMERSHQYTKGRSRGKKATSGAVKSVLRNPIVIGKRTFGVRHVGKFVKNKTTTTHNVNRLEEADHVVDITHRVEPAISEALFFEIQTLLDKNSKEFKQGRRGNPNPSAKHKYSGLLRCGHCGAKFCAETQKRGKIYICPQSKSKHLRCPGRKLILEKDLAKMIYAWKHQTWKSAEFHRHIHKECVRMYSAYKSRKAGVNQTEIVEVERQQRQLDKLFDLATKNPNEKILSKINAKQSELEKLKAEVIARSDQQLSDDQYIEDLLRPAITPDMSELDVYLSVQMLAAKVACDAVDKDPQAIEKKADDKSDFFDGFAKSRTGKAPDIDRLVNEGTIYFKEVSGKFAPDYLSFDLKSGFSSNYSHEYIRYKDSHYTES